MTQKLRNRLKFYRAQMNWTQSDLAIAVGVSRKTINTVENGIFVPSTILALKMAAALEATVHDLFELDDGSGG
jgi:putative transcriptional regulator